MINAEKDANKMDGLVALAMVSLEAIHGASQPFGVLGRSDVVAGLHPTLHILPISV